MTYEIRYGTPNHCKAIETNDYFQAHRMFKKIQKFMTNHNLKWTVALWQNTDRGGLWLVRSFKLK